MKAKFILSFIAALFMQFTTVSADNYTDGITKLIENEAIATVNAKMFDQFSKLPDDNHRKLIFSLIKFRKNY